ERAQTAQAWANTLVTLESVLSPDEKRIVAANNIDAVKDAITDDNGSILRWDDVDPQSMQQASASNDIIRLMNQTEDANQETDNVQPASGESVVTLNKLVIDQMNRAMIDVFTAARMLGNKNPAEELRGMFWVGNQLVPQEQLQNIWKYGTLIAPSTTNADLIVETEPEVLDTDETDSVAPPAPPPPDTPAMDTTEDETPDENFDAPVEKDYRRTAKRFRETFNEVIKLMREGITSPASVRIILLDELRRGGRFAYLDGLKRAGKRRPSFDDKGETALAKWLNEQRPLVSSFVTSIMEDKFTDKQLAQKGLQWTNGSLSEMLYKGMFDGQPKKLWKWVIDPRKEHCLTCLRLNGQVHRMKVYVERRLLPQSPRLLCTGQFCGCKLKATTEKARGRLAGIKTKVMIIKDWQQYERMAH
ncbi:MAG: hypothetical protein ACYTBJ_21320, partial [Planctomycetota bacterium]